MSPVFCSPISMLNARGSAAELSRVGKEGGVSGRGFKSEGEGIFLLVFMVQLCIAHFLFAY